MISIREMDLNHVQMPRLTTEANRIQRYFNVICTEMETPTQALGHELLPKLGDRWARGFETVFCSDVVIEQTTNFPSVRMGQEGPLTGEIHYTVVAQYQMLPQSTLGRSMPILPPIGVADLGKWMKEMEEERLREKPWVDSMLNDPNSDLQRLIYADHLDDGDYPKDADRAKLIRLQIEQSKMKKCTAYSNEPCHPLIKVGTRVLLQSDVCICDWHQNFREQEKLLTAHAAKWSQCNPSAAGMVRPTDVIFERGFVSRLNNIASWQWLRHGRAILEWYPISMVTFSNTQPNQPKSYEIVHLRNGHWLVVIGFILPSNAIELNRGLHQYLNTVPGGLFHSLSDDGERQMIFVYETREGLLNEFSFVMNLPPNQTIERDEGSWGHAAVDSPAYRAGQELALQIERRTLDFSMRIPMTQQEARDDWRTRWARDLTNELPLIIEPQAFVFGTEDATIDTGADSDSGAEPTGDDDNA